MTDRNEHRQSVYEFLRKAQQDDPDVYKAVCDKYPVLSRRQWGKVRERELPQGLLNYED